MLRHLAFGATLTLAQHNGQRELLAVGEPDNFLGAILPKRIHSGRDRRVELVPGGLEARLVHAHPFLVRLSGGRWGPDRDGHTAGLKASTEPPRPSRRGCGCRPVVIVVGIVIARHVNIVRGPKDRVRLLPRGISVDKG